MRFEEEDKGANSEQIDRIDARRGHTFVYRKLHGEAEFNYNLAKDGKGIHNLEYTEELLEFASHRLDEAIKEIAEAGKTLHRERSEVKNH